LKYLEGTGKASWQEYVSLPVVLFNQILIRWHVHTNWTLRNTYVSLYQPYYLACIWMLPSSQWNGLFFEPVICAM
jgi:hypothetical protein